MFRVLALALLAYAFTRALMVLALGDVFFYGEELEKGAVTLALGSDTGLPLSSLPYHPYEGGGFVASLFKLPFFGLLGPTVLAHKAAAIAWGLMILAASVRLAGHHGGRGAAAMAGALLVLGPAHFQRESLLHLGIHFESLLWVTLVLDLGLRLAAAPEDREPPRWTAIGLGLAAGFGTYFSYQVPLAVLAVIGLLACTGWRRIFTPSLMVATVVGLLPLLWMFLSVGDAILDIHGAAVGEQGGFSRLASVLAAGLASVGAKVGLGLATAASVAGLVAVPPGRVRRRALGLLAGFVLLWVLVAGLTGMVPAATAQGHWVQFVRLAPLIHAGLLFVALSAGPALRFGVEEVASNRLARVAAAGLVLLGGVHWVGTVHAGDLGAAGRNLAALRGTTGVELRGAFVKLAPRLEDPEVTDPALRAARSVVGLARIDDPRSELLSAELAAAAAQDAGGVGADELLEALAAELGDGHPREALALGLGPVVFREHQGDVRRALSSEALSPVLAEALGRYGSGWVSYPPFVSVELEKAAGTLHEEAFLRGLGRRVYRSSVIQPYWGALLRVPLVLRPVEARARVAEVLDAAGASDVARAAVLRGFDDAEGDFQAPGTTLRP